MKAMLLAWAATLALLVGGAVFLLSYEKPSVEAKQAERMTVTKVDQAPVLSSGKMAFDPTLTKEEKQEEDCPSSC